MKNILLILVFILVQACQSKPDAAARLAELKKQKETIEKEIAELEKQSDSTKAEKVKLVKTMMLKKSTFQYIVQTQGQVQSQENTNVSAKASGVVQKVFVREGDMVKKGQLLAQLDDAAAKKGREELKTNYDLLKTVYERQQNLWNQHIGSEIQFLQAKANFESIQKRLASTDEQLAYFSITAPISGIVESVNIKAGEAAMPGMPSFVLNNTAELKVALKISEPYALKIQKGNPAVISFPDMDDKINSKVTFVGRNIDLNTRSFPVEIKLPSSATLRTNMTSIVRILYREVPNTLAIPVNLIQDINNEKVVYTVVKKDKGYIAKKCVVKIKGVSDNIAEIGSGIKEGDQIISVGFQSLNDGEAISL